MVVIALASRLRRYWLRQLDEAAMTAIERRYLTDPDFFHLLEAAAAELAADYAEGRLGPDDRRTVEELARSPAWRDRLALAVEVRRRLAATDA